MATPSSGGMEPHLTRPLIRSKEPEFAAPDTGTAEPRQARLFGSNEGSGRVASTTRSANTSPRRLDPIGKAGASVRAELLVETKEPDFPKSTNGAIKSARIKLRRSVSKPRCAQPSTGRATPIQASPDTSTKDSARLRLRRSVGGPVCEKPETEAAESSLPEL